MKKKKGREGRRKRGKKEREGRRDRRKNTEKEM